MKETTIAFGAAADDTAWETDQRHRFTVEFEADQHELIKIKSPGGESQFVRKQGSAEELSPLTAGDAGLSAGLEQSADGVSSETLRNRLPEEKLERILEHLPDLTFSPKIAVQVYRYSDIYLAVSPQRPSFWILRPAREYIDAEWVDLTAPEQDHLEALGWSEPRWNDGVYASQPRQVLRCPKITQSARTV